MANSLSNQLRKGTSKSHSMAENVSFVKSFLGGVVDRTSYRKLISNLYFVYSTMEEAMEKNKDHICIKPLYFPELNRKESLEKDLQYYYGDNWKNYVSLSAATKKYVERIRVVSTEKPELLVAHAYTRYLGDLSGGQVLKKIAQRAMNLPHNSGLAFYDFSSIKDVQEFKQNYKKALDSLPLDHSVIDQIVFEANVSFTMNMKMFQELETSFIRILMALIANTMTNAFSFLKA
uniref:heme oxygenase (biliverdin-producing) n=1 Tax=Cryptomonas sp. SAG 977-2f TaxID=279061 RepID=A0A679CB74_9CRYP|nr:heme oxygenase [Cryptomonas sp. SAG 977-2f]